jgi:holo-[acyl-carrier protein] synthase
LGVKCSRVYTARRYGELEAAACGSNAGQLAIRAVPGPGAVSAADDRSVRCGIDIEEIEALPRAADYWEHEFYRNSFTDAEIAYCSVQQEPRQHFAARWAAKEAVRKLAPQYLHVESRDLEVTLNENGAPAMTLRGSDLPVAVSLAHTGSVAVAVAVNAVREDESADDGPAGPEPPPETRASRVAVRAGSSPRLARVVLPVLTVAALGIAAWALLRTFG